MLICMSTTHYLCSAAQDLLSNPLIVPVKILRGHEVVDFEGVLDCAFHPTQPWIFTAGADATICLFTNP
jgi:ribosome biogenesis protein ERB1